MKISNRFMLLGGVVGVIMTAVSPVFAEGEPGGHGKMWQAADTNQNGSIDRAEFDAMRDGRFSAMDSDGNGSLTAAEFKAAHDKRRAEVKAQIADGEGRPDRSARMMAEVDSSKDGRITADEWQASALQRFVRMDANGDGAITADEMSDMRGKHRGDGQDAAGKRLKAGHGGFMDRMDSNGDGQVSRGEWDAAGNDMFSRMDKDRDGQIVPAELPHRKMHMKKPDQTQSEP